MTSATAEFAPTRVGSGARLPVVIAPLLLIAVIGLALFGSRAEPAAEAQADISVPAVRQLTWSVSNPNEVRTKGVRLMRLSRVVDPYMR